MRTALAALARQLRNLFGGAPAPDPGVGFRGDGAVTNAAVALARAALPAFRANTPDAGGFSAAPGSCVKAGFAADAPGRGVEYIRVGPFRRLAADRSAGALANAPKALTGQHPGDVVPFASGMAFDGNLPADDGRLRGDLTRRLVAARLPGDEAGSLRARLTDPPLPGDRARP